jgi:hypothetical protein
MSRVVPGALAATATFLIVLFAAARAIDSSTETIAASNRAWLVACALAGLAAGFLGARLAGTAAVPARYAAAIAGPGALALLFALTTTARDEAGVWAALAISVAAAALGAAGRERLPQRRR